MDHSSNENNSAPENREPESGLFADQLGTRDLAVSTVANIGPGIDFYFGFGIIVATAGVGAPLTIVAAAIAVSLLAWTTAEFTRAEPSAGSFITYIESGFGNSAGAWAALLVTVGYTVAMAGVITMTGGFVSMTVMRFAHVSVPWIGPTLLISVVGLVLMTRGVKLSTKIVAIALAIQVGVMVLVCVITLAQEPAHLNLAPFTWGNISGGLAGLSAGFPLALYMFIGWENGPALAEEARNPTRSVPRALAISVGVASVLFLLFAYSTIIGFHENVTSVGRSSIPFLTVADRALGPVAFLAWIAGIASILATFIAGTTSQARMIFDGGREGFLPQRLGVAHPRHGTPVAALGLIVASGLVIIVGWWAAHVVGAGTGSMDPVGLYAECSTIGTMIILVVYAATNLSLPVFIVRQHREHISIVRHVGVPLLGTAALIIPFIELFTPGQPAPYSAYPYVTLVIIVGAGVWVGLSARHRQRRKAR